MREWLAAALAVGMGALAAGSALRAQSSHTPYPAEMKAGDEFAGLRAEWAQNLHDKRVDASVAEYTATAEFVDPSGARVRGTEALRKLFATVTATFDSDLKFDSKKVEVSGDLAFDSGSYEETLTVRASGKEQHASGSYLTVYERGAGKWLIAEQEWTGVVSDGSGPKLEAHPVVALTFDDLPAAGSLPAGMNRSEILTRLVEELKANHLKGTYGFVNAVKLESDPDAQKALHIWVDGGMNIGSHTWAHKPLTGNTAEMFEGEIEKNEAALKEYAGGRDWHWFRYPFLWEGDTVEKRRAVRAYLKDHGYRVAEVSLDFEDYAWNDAYGRCVAKNDADAIAWLKQSYLETAEEYVRLGREEELIAFGHEIRNVMLLHATAFTTLMLPDLIGQLHAEGFRLEGLEKAEADPAYGLDPDAALKYGGTLPDQFMDSRRLPYPAFKPKPFQKLKDLCN